MEGLADPLEPELLRPLTFDTARRGPDVVHAHLGHALVDRAQRLLRSAVWGHQRALSRVTGVTAALPDEVRPGELLVTIVTRLVIVGADAARLHEEVVLTGRALPENGRSRRIEVDERRYEAVRSAVEAALEPDACRSAPRGARQRLVDAWPDLRNLLVDDVARRAEARALALNRQIEERKAEELTRIDGVTDHMCRTLTDVLADPVPVQLRLDELDSPERAQLESDRIAWRTKLLGLDVSRERQREEVHRRYAGQRELTFPVAVVLVAPEDGS